MVQSCKWYLCIVVCITKSSFASYLLIGNPLGTLADPHCVRWKRIYFANSFITFVTWSHWLTVFLSQYYYSSVNIEYTCLPLQCCVNFFQQYLLQQSCKNILLMNVDPTICYLANQSMSSNCTCVWLSIKNAYSLSLVMQVISYANN